MTFRSAYTGYGIDVSESFNSALDEGDLKENPGEAGKGMQGELLLPAHAYRKHKHHYFNIIYNRFTMATPFML